MAQDLMVSEMVCQMLPLSITWCYTSCPHCFFFSFFPGFEKEENNGAKEEVWRRDSAAQIKGKVMLAASVAECRNVNEE